MIKLSTLFGFGTFAAVLCGSFAWFISATDNALPIVASIFSGVGMAAVSIEVGGWVRKIVGYYFDPME